MKSPFFLCGLLILLVGCNQNTPTPAVSPNPTVYPTAASTPVIPQSENDPSKLISDTGIGEARIGMSLGELKQALGSNAEFRVESPYIVDFDAIAVRQNGEAQYYILYPAGTTLQDSDPIELIYTENPQYRTVDGVGPQTPIQTAEAVYGQPTLSYNYSSEGREAARFANQPQKLLFGLGNANRGDLAGIYPESQDEYNETSQYKEDAKIQSIIVRP
ncbi:hypothetical protein [Geitlerinema calcuttense]|uniref:Uncharacterized protein n=1 Tax=Geitlerinema calcuttense NRMC-F 0142 TaxID=2922238 RepID=A0ABT7LWN7_9CYAN|nr:hypothetical protein [Geitlerinema calcuttense]MDL5056441.1 hypothetical protein [Geitlerinema calcuttense NRMC-F 0142]